MADEKKMTDEDKMKTLYERYNKCRDLELDRFWKNSVFVWVFLALCFGAFGKILMDYLEYDCKEHKIADKGYYEIILAIISFFGLLFSKIWTWMARGLKAWYEVYENAIWDIESNSNQFEFDRRYTIDNYWSVKTNGLIGFNSDKISPSRIVILIGRLMSISWGGSLVVCLFYHFHCSFFETFWPVLPFWVLLAICSFVIWMCYGIVQTTTLRSPDENVIFWKIKNKILQDNAQIENQNGTIDATSSHNESNETKKIPYIYFEVKYGIIKFFFKTSQDKDSFKQVIEQYIKNEFSEKKLCWLMSIKRKIVFYFRGEKMDDTILFFPQNYKTNIMQTKQN